MSANPPCQPRVRPVCRLCDKGRGNTRWHPNRHGTTRFGKETAVDEEKQEKERRSLGGVLLTSARSAGSFRT